jgi:hypothetical protein
MDLRLRGDDDEGWRDVGAKAQRDVKKWYGMR